MVTKFALIQAAAPASATTLDFTKSGFGTGRNGAIFWVTKATANGTRVDHSCISFGATDGTNQFVMAGSSEHGLGTSDTYRRMASDECIMILDPTNGSVAAEANFDSWITDGVRVNFAATPDEQYMINCLLMETPNVFVHTYNTSNPTTVRTDVGFEGDFGLFTTTAAATNDTAAGDMHMNIGMADNQTVITNADHPYISDDGRSTARIGDRVTDDRMLTSLNPAPGAPSVSRDYDITAWSSTGYTVTQQTGTFSANVGAIIVQVDSGVSHWVGITDTPTATGNHTHNEPNFEPAMCLMLPTFHSTVPANGENGVAGIYACTADDEACCAISDDDNAATINCSSLTDNNLNIDDDAGSSLFVGTFTDFQSTGPRINYTTTDGTARKWPMLAVQEDTGGASFIPRVMTY